MKHPPAKSKQDDSPPSQPPSPPTAESESGSDHEGSLVVSGQSSCCSSHGQTVGQTHSLGGGIHGAISGSGSGVSGVPSTTTHLENSSLTGHVPALRQLSGDSEDTGFATATHTCTQSTNATGDQVDSGFALDHDMQPQGSRQLVCPKLELPAMCSTCDSTSELVIVKTTLKESAAGEISPAHTEHSLDTHTTSTHPHTSKQYYHSREPDFHRFFNVHEPHHF